MSDIDEILQAVPLDDVANELGVDRATAEQAARTAIPTLLAGLQANAADPAGAASLAGALGSHDNSLGASASLADIDESDGQAIVSNIFGSHKDAVVSTLAESPATGSLGGGALKKLLPILAPIVLSWLAKKYGGGQGGSLPGILESVLGGASGASGSATGSGGGLGDILGGLLGGVAEQQASPRNAGATSDSGGLGGLGSILGDLLGGGKR